MFTPHPQVYFAGPDIFSPEWPTYVREVKTLCQANCVLPVFPVDDGRLGPGSIVDMNLSLIAASTGVCANLSPFRGAEPDSGTVFEVAFAFANGKTVVGYCPRESVEERVSRMLGPLSNHNDGWPVRDSSGCGVETFGDPVNIMISKTIPLRDDLASAVAAVAALLRGAR